MFLIILNKLKHWIKTS